MTTEAKPYSAELRCLAGCPSVVEPPGIEPDRDAQSREVKRGRMQVIRADGR